MTRDDTDKAVLLFVLWYCHKRGREVRLENERLVTEEEVGNLNKEAGKGTIRPTETLTTTAPEGASVEEIREGVKEAQQQHETTTAKEQPKESREDVTSPPTRSKSKLGLWTRSNQKSASTATSTSRIEPYPGT